MSNGITVVWVPGAWHGPEAFNPAAEIVAAKGYTNTFVHTPSVGRALEDPFEDSIEIKKRVLEELDDKDRDVVLVVHSYGGVCGTNALEGLAKKDRQGKKTSVIGTVYLAAFALQKGACLWDGIGQKPLPWFIEKGDLVEADKPEHIFYNDCTAGQQTQYKAALKPHSYNTLKQPVVYEVWKDIPSTYLVCELDNAIPVDAQRGMIEHAGSFKDSKSIKAGHSPFISMPEETAEYIVESIEKHFTSS